MQQNLKDILSHLSTSIDQETLLLYLNGKLTAEKQHELEKELQQSEFEADALEGLQQFKNKKQLDFLVDQLQRDLKKKTAQRRLRRTKGMLKTEPWLWAAALILLLLLVLAYFVIQWLR